ncbi:hypothetical protein N7513_003234 [Penicillium frequentans]|uniref:C2H2-type domain-containing protein n=1 Tax=Penicillium frequentans TaxID=3151616 RepID=A0AAD6CHW0_9EURO|nr:hypothetical protein N7494_013221 [Penicillium glabrum]KAJ5557648.1 hypothetical protein N7513_003234 [Penicillium glabrum]
MDITCTCYYDHVHTPAQSPDTTFLYRSVDDSELVPQLPLYIPTGNHVAQNYSSGEVEEDWLLGVDLSVPIMVDAHDMGEAPDPGQTIHLQSSEKGLRPQRNNKCSPPPKKPKRAVSKVPSRQPQRTLRCEDCGKSFKRETYLIRHSERMHPTVRKTNAFGR